MSFSLNGFSKQISTKDGAFDLLNIFNYGGQWAQFLPIGSRNHAAASKVSQAFGTAADSLFIVDFVNYGVKLRDNLYSLVESKDLKKDGKETVYHSMAFMSAGTDTVKFFLAIMGKVLAVPFQVGGLVADMGKNLFDLHEEIEDRAALKGRVDLLDKMTLVKAKIINTVSILACDALLLVGLVFAVYAGATAPVLLMFQTATLITNFAVRFLTEPAPKLKAAIV